MESTEGLRRLAVGQGISFAASGPWPIVRLGSLQVVAGPEPEGWLVKTVGAVIAVAG